MFPQNARKDVGTGPNAVQELSPMNKRYQVFVSSTYDDLREERSEVMRALLELDCIPSGMELFPAADEDQWTLIKEVIDDCDYYVVIIGGRYGSLQAGIDSLRSVALAGMPYGAKIVDRQHRSFVSDLTSSGQLEKLIVDVKNPNDLRKTADFLCEKMTDQA